MYTFRNILCALCLVSGSMLLQAADQVKTEPPVSVEIFPNPMLDWLQIDVCDDEDFVFHYQIVSITGHVVKYGQVTSQENMILVDELLKGQYILKLVSENFYTAKVIQKRS